MRTQLIYVLSVIPIIILVLCYYNYQESGSEWSIQCGLYKYTGLYCPGCGGQRALHSLLHFDILSALKYNILIFPAVPILLYLYYLLIRIYLVKDRGANHQLYLSNKFAIIFVLVLVTFFIIRNIPFVPFSYLLPI